MLNTQGSKPSCILYAGIISLAHHLGLHPGKSTRLHQAPGTLLSAIMGVRRLLVDLTRVAGRHCGCEFMLINPGAPRVRSLASTLCKLTKTWCGGTRVMTNSTIHLYVTSEICVALALVHLLDYVQGDCRSCRASNYTKRLLNSDILGRPTLPFARFTLLFAPAAAAHVDCGSGALSAVL